MKLVQKPRQLPQSTLQFPSHRLSACADLGRNITHADMAVGHPLHNQLLEAALGESHQILKPHAHLPGRPAQHRACRRAFVAVRRKGSHRPRCAVRNSQWIDVLPRHVAPSSQQKRTRRASLQTTGSQVQTRGAGRRGPKSMVPARLREHAGKLRASFFASGSASPSMSRTFDFVVRGTSICTATNEEIQCVIVALSSPGSHEGRNRVWLRPMLLGRWEWLRILRVRRSSARRWIEGDWKVGRAVIFVESLSGDEEGDCREPDDREDSAEEKGKAGGRDPDLGHGDICD